jgi:hypothetical protein
MTSAAEIARHEPTTAMKSANERAEVIGPSLVRERGSNHLIGRPPSRLIFLIQQQVSPFVENSWFSGRAQKSDSLQSSEDSDSTDTTRSDGRFIALTGDLENLGTGSTSFQIAEMEGVPCFTSARSG